MTHYLHKFLLLLLPLVIAGCGGAVARKSSSSSAPAKTHGELLLETHIPSTLESQRKDYEGFTLSFNRANGTPNWVAWELLAEETDGPHVRKEADFWQDADINGCATKGDYTHSGYDRGHLCPAADQKWSAKAMQDCFTMANICPQDGALNRGAWQTLEKKERQWASELGGLVIVAGPIYEMSDNKRIGENHVRVPSAYFKVLLAHLIDEPRAIAFVYPNMSAPGNMKNYAMSVDELEGLTGYDFFSALPDDVENQVEASFSWRPWSK